MEVYRVAKCRYIEDLSGRGAGTYGGRWNSKGVNVLYAAETPSLALLENVVHMSAVITEDYCLGIIILPEKNILTLSEQDLPVGWSAYPSLDKLKSIGDKFIKENILLAMKIPSVIMPEEKIILINPDHPDFTRVKIKSTRKIPIDERLR